LSSHSQSAIKERPTSATWKQGLSRTLATLGVLALTTLLLVWGLSAMQWTILTSNNDVRDALATSSFQEETATYSIRQGTQAVYPITISFVASGSGYGCGPTSSGIPACSLPKPGSNTSITIADYVIFSFTNPNGSALAVWYTGPQGNLTQYCNGPNVPQLTCAYSPNPPGARTGPYTTFFETNTTGNYSINLLSTPCAFTPNYCSTTTAVGSLTISVAHITYSRPYWTFGLATVIVSGVAIAATIAYVAIISYRTNKQRRRRNPRAQVIPPSQQFD
jgi:hypothetical protein